MTYQNKKYGTKSAPKKSKRKWWVASLLVAVILLLGFGVYWQFIRDHHKTPAVSATGDTKGDTAVQNNNTGTKTDSTVPGHTVNPTPSDQTGKQQVPPTTGGAAPLEPTGDFVSSHGTNQPVPRSAAMESVCTSTPGASCVISFTQGSVTKSLPAQTTDKGGSTYWNQWTPQTYGLTAGSWTITATATLNGQTKSATDALPLKVAP